MRMRASIVIALVMAILAATGVATKVGAQAYTTKYITSITYQNIDIGDASVTLYFYSEGSGTPVTIQRPVLKENAGASYYVGDASGLSAGFKGAAVLSANKRIVATMVQIPQNSPVKNRPLSNGFDESAGAANVRIVTVLKNTFDQNTQFSIQNVDSEANNLTVKFVSASTGSVGQVVHTETFSNLPPSSVKYYDAGTISQLGASFNGSAIIEATRTTGGAAGKVVATALELNITTTGASAFEGLSSDAGTLYMPSAICNAFGGQNTAYAVQNTGLANANVTVTYSFRPASDPNAAIQTQNATAVIAPGAKASFRGCDTMPANSTGSAVITSTGANIVAIGKVFGAGLSTSAPGSPTGAQKLALPYVRYSASQFDTGARQRTFIAVQNVGPSDLAAGAVTIKYLGRDGTVIGTHALGALPAKGKLSSNASLATGDAAALAEFGYYSDGFGGSAIVEGPSGSQLVAVARVASLGVGEDYNGMPVN